MSACIGTLSENFENLATMLKKHKINFDRIVNSFNKLSELKPIKEGGAKRPPVPVFPL